MNVPVIALRGLTVLPGQVVHFDAGRKISIESPLPDDLRTFINELLY